MENTELHEMKSIGPYYSWTNKTVMTRIDRALINEEWNAHFNYMQVRYEANSLSDHTPLMVQFLPSPKPKTRFQYCDMWARHAEFHSIITSCLPSHTSFHKWRELKCYLGHVKKGLQQLSRRAFHDLKEQQETSRYRLTQIQQDLQSHPDHSELISKEKEAREHYISILSSSIALLQQQCKVEWIKYGDTSSTMFFAKTKQRKLATYIYSIKDATGKWTEGFKNVGKTIFGFCKNLLGPQSCSRSPV